FDVVPAERGAEVLAAPDGDAGERSVVGQVEPDDLEHGASGQELPDPGRRAPKAEADDPALRADPGGAELAVQGGQSGQVLSERLGGDQPTETLPALDQAVGAQCLERPPYGDPAGLVGGGEVGL